MKYFYLLLFMLHLACNKIESFSSYNYCKKMSMEVECEMYSCGKTYCSNSKNDCDYLIYIEALLKGSRKQEKKQKKFKAFLKSISNCDPNGHVEFKNQWAHRLNFG
jgi:hypothetical protein